METVNGCVFLVYDLFEVTDENSLYLGLYFNPK